MFRSFFSAMLILLCFALLEAAVLSNIRLLPAIPDFLLLCVIYFSYNRGRSFGVVTGFTSGLFLDFLSASPLGLHCLLRSILGWCFGFLHSSLNIDGIFFPALLAFISTILKAFLLRAISIFFPISVIHYDLSSSLFLWELVLNVIFAPFVFKFLGVFRSQLSEKV